ncbi:MAG: hypothetical protein MUF23_03480 [Pirellula sp.]|nr:hypothetical protein [Pirellula sp.]
MSFRRRDFLRTTACTGVLCGASSHWAYGQETMRRKIAFLGTVIFRHSHAQHFIDRHAMGYTWGGRWQAPRFDVASVFIDQRQSEGDLSQQRIDKYRLKQYPTIEEALTLGTSKLAVDGVVIIAEHGDYPTNEKGQKRYPRYDWYKRVVKVFEASGRSVPVFNDKHLSTRWEECEEMVADAKRLSFPFLAGSSLPVTWRFPSIDMPVDTPLKESVCVCYGGVDSYDFHGLETAQCMSERRKGGEVGIRSVTALRGDKVWEEMERSSREDTRRLMVAALTRSHNLPVEGGFPTEPVTYEWAKRSLPGTIAYFIEHRDGFRTTMFLCPIQDFNYAGLRSDNDEIISCQMYLPMPGHGSTTADFFNPLARHIEELVLTGQTPYPVERTLLTSGMVIGGVESLAQGGVAYQTPQMGVAYRNGAPPSFWRE